MRYKIGHGKSMNSATGTYPAVEIDYRKTNNGHTAIIGGSGVGKTYQLNKLVNSVSSDAPNVRMHVFDVHGDVKTSQGSRVDFSASTPYGLNPLTIDPDPHYGGVHRRIAQFIKMINAGGKLGVKQEATLRKLLIDLYALNGFKANEPQTWDIRLHTNKRHKVPTISDLLRFTEFHIRQLKTGTGSEAYHALKNVEKTVKSLNRKKKQANASTATDKDIDQLEAAKLKAKETYNSYIDTIQSGEELDDIIAFDNIDNLTSLLQRIQNLDAAGIFKDVPPPFNDNCPAWEYDIKALTTDEQRMFVEVSLNYIFQHAKAEPHTKYPRRFIILDEAHKYLSKDPDNIINVIVREGRKFGIALILISQELKDFPTTIITNTAVKIILGVDEYYHDQCSRKLNLARARLASIRPRNSALVQIKSPASTENSYLDVTLAA